MENYQPYNPQKTEPEIYALWEKHDCFKPNLKSKKKPYSILLPPPNANADLHAGHAMYTIEDLLIRFKRMQGHPTLWLPGTDHAGYETQFVYEKNLKKEGKSRFDFDRETLYQNISKFVTQNSGKIQKQLKKLGFSLDWSRETYMLDPHVVNTVLNTFEKMHQDGLIYRGGYMVNYCPKCGTTFTNLEIDHVEQKDPLYYIKYGPLTVATVRPETKFGDTALAVHPEDKRYQKYIGKEIECEGLLGKFKLKVISDKSIDPQFGTGVVKITPAHDPNDYEMAKRHHLEMKTVINLNGRLNELTGPYSNLTVFSAREKVVADLKQKNLLVKIDENYSHSVAVCYKGRHAIEPLIMPNWFLKMKPLADPAIKAVQNNQIQIIPSRFKKLYFHWMKNIVDWPISRQIVWGIRIPVWYSISQNPEIHVSFLDKNKTLVAGNVRELCGKYSLSEIEKGLQTLLAPADAAYLLSRQKPQGDYLPETDSFDTWFSSGQWPLTTLGYPKGKDYQTFYPTSTLDTMWDILFFWVARMIMFGLYLTKKVPFKTVYLHSMVTDQKGQKMSKSKGNVINPIDIIEKYGADALRMSLLVGSTPGNPIALSEEKVKGFRNFSNKIWNAARFILEYNQKYLKLLNFSKYSINRIKSKENLSIITKINKLDKLVTHNIEKYSFSNAGEEIYSFFWHEFCDSFLENSKTILNKSLDSKDKKNETDIIEKILTLNYVLENTLILLHPFMPFVTEAIWQKMGKKSLLIIKKWPY